MSEHNFKIIGTCVYEDGYECFDLYEPANKPSKKSKIISLAKQHNKLIEKFERLYEDNQRLLFEIQDINAENEKLKEKLEGLLESKNALEQALLQSGVAERLSDRGNILVVKKSNKCNNKTFPLSMLRCAVRKKDKKGDGINE